MRTLALLAAVSFGLGSSAGAATLTVTSTADSGPGTFHQALIDSNASVGVLDTIAFAIPGAGVHTIVVSTDLPTATDPVIIDGTTQPGYVDSPLIELTESTPTQGLRHQRRRKHRPRPRNLRVRRPTDVHQQRRQPRRSLLHRDQRDGHRDLERAGPPDPELSGHDDRRNRPRGRQRDLRIDRHGHPARRLGQHGHPRQHHRNRSDRRPGSRPTRSAFRSSTPTTSSSEAPSPEWGTSSPATTASGSPSAADRRTR